VDTCALFGFDGAELFAVAQDQVHVLVEGHERADQPATILHGDLHAVIDEVQHLTTLGERHLSSGVGTCAYQDLCTRD